MMFFLCVSFGWPTKSCIGLWQLFGSIFVLLVHMKTYSNISRFNTVEGKIKKHPDIKNCGPPSPQNTKLNEKLRSRPNVASTLPGHAWSRFMLFFNIVFWGEGGGRIAFLPRVFLTFFLQQYSQARAACMRHTSSHIVHTACAPDYTACTSQHEHACAQMHFTAWTCFFQCLSTSYFQMTSLYSDTYIHIHIYIYTHIDSHTFFLSAQL